MLSIGQDGMLDIRFGSIAKAPFTARWYSLDGTKLSESTMAEGQSEYHMDLSAAGNGVVAVQTSGATSIEGSSLIRIH